MDKYGRRGGVRGRGLDQDGSLEDGAWKDVGRPHPHPLGVPAQPLEPRTAGGGGGV